MLVIDRILNGIAVCVEDNAVLEIPISQIGGDACEGDVLRLLNGEKYYIDTVETRKRRNEIYARFQKLKNYRKK